MEGQAGFFVFRTVPYISHWVKFCDLQPLSIMTTFIPFDPWLEKASFGGGFTKNGSLLAELSSKKPVFSYFRTITPEVTFQCKTP